MSNSGRFSLCPRFAMRPCTGKERISTVKVIKTIHPLGNESEFLLPNHVVFVLPPTTTPPRAWRHSTCPFLGRYPRHDALELGICVQQKCIDSFLSEQIESLSGSSLSQPDKLTPNVFERRCAELCDLFPSFLVLLCPVRCPRALSAKPAVKLGGRR